MSDAEILLGVARSLAARAGAVSRGGAPLPPLLFLTDGARTPAPWRTAAALPAGSGVIFRTFGAEDAAETGRRLCEATQASGVRLLVAVDEALADRLGADGLHLPERHRGDAATVRARHPSWLITAAVHAATNEDLSALDAVLVSPVFTAGGASGSREPLGIEGFAEIAGALSVPAYALGGITAEAADRLKTTPACGLAAVGAITRAFGPAKS